MTETWVFGAGGRVGKACVDYFLADGHAVTAFSRSLLKIEHRNLTQIAVDFDYTWALRASIHKRMNVLVPQYAVFCQRYRPPATGWSDMDAIRRGLDVEIAPVLALVEAARGRCDNLKIAVVTSVAGVRTVADQPFWYHALKATQISLVNFIAAREASWLTISAVVLSDVQDPPGIAANIATILESQPT